MKKTKSFTSARNLNVLKSIWFHRKDFIQMFKEVVSGKHKLSMATTLALLGSLIYIISPIDIVPDFIPVAGWLDDGFIFYYLLKRLLKETQVWARTNEGSLVVLNR